MKHMRKIMALVIAMVMMAAMIVPAMADDPVTYKITLQNDDQTGTHTYSAYKILSGDLDANTNELKNLDWALTPAQANALLTLLKADATFGVGVNNAFYGIDSVTAQNSAQTAAKFAKVFSGEADESDKAKALAVAMGTVVEDEQVPVAQSSTTTSQPTVDVVAKSNTVSSSKFVDDVNDSDTTEDEVEWEKTADYDIGDIIPYKLVGTLPSNYDDYERYYYKFTDTMTHLTLYEDDTHKTKVYVFEDATSAENDTMSKAKDITDFFTIGTNDTANLTVEIKDWAATGDDKLGLKNIPATTATIDADSVIVVYYYAKLGEDAVIGNYGNPNTMTLEYSKNPNKEGIGDKGETPEDKNVVFTYNVEVDKVDENLQALKGAAFALFKKLANPSDEQKTKSILDVRANGVTLEEKVTVYKSGNDYYLLIKNWPQNAAGNTFSYDGIDDGEYLVAETIVPEGYNPAADAKFTVSADTEADTGSSTGYKLKDFQVTSSNGFTGSDVGAAATVSEGTGASAKSYTIAANTDGAARAAGAIKNQSGAILPSTGGIGTTIFYVIGAMLVVGAGIILVTRRRMSAN